MSLLDKESVLCMDKGRDMDLSRRVRRQSFGDHKPERKEYLHPRRLRGDDKGIDTCEFHI